MTTGADPAGDPIELPRVEDTLAFGRRLGELLRPGDLVLLAGPLGAGKTVLAKGIAAGYKVPAEPNDKGETTDDKGERLTRPGILADYFPSPFANENAARANNGGALPPDLSMIVKQIYRGGLKEAANGDKAVIPTAVAV